MKLSTVCNNHQSPIQLVCLNQFCEYGRKMCANCQHPNCDLSRAKSLRDFANMIKVNGTKEEAKKLVYYESGAYLKEFKEQFLKIVNIQRNQCTQQFDQLVKLIDGIQQAPTTIEPILKLCENWEKLPDDLLLEYFDASLKLAGDKTLLKQLLQQKNKQADMKTNTLQSYENDMKLLESTWSGEFLKLKEKYFQLVNQKVEVKEQKRQLIIAFGEDLGWVGQINQIEDDIFRQKVNNWKIDWQEFKSIDIDDVSVDDHIQTFKNEKMQIITKTNSGPVLIKLLQNLIDINSTDENNFQLLGVICQCLKETQFDLFRYMGQYNTPQLAIEIGDVQLSEKGYQQFSSCLKEIKKSNNVLFNFESLLQNSKFIPLVFGALKELKQITYLDINLSKNKFGQVGLDELSNSLAQLKLLKTLRLNLSQLLIFQQIIKRELYRRNWSFRVLSINS